jgi:hypothetical protein
MTSIAELQKRWEVHGAANPIQAEMISPTGSSSSERERASARWVRWTNCAWRRASQPRIAGRSPLYRCVTSSAPSTRCTVGTRRWPTRISRSGMSKLADPKEDARWLFFIDTLLTEGADRLIILKELGTDPEISGVSLEKYSPDQPRVPAGNRDGGQWTSGNSEVDTGAARPARAQGVQVADASTNWAQYMGANAGTGRPSSNATASSQSAILQPHTGNLCDRGAYFLR